MASQVPPSTKPTPDAFKPLPPAADLYEPEDYRLTFQEHKSHTGASKFKDPCAKASKASLQCLEQTRYNRGECYEYFKAYRECKKRWVEQRKADNAGVPRPQSS
ncbi:cytochrome c oxidase-assembly factor COX23, mitochondrial [Cutaneotrichosporon oleaginosum]|uniref:Cytochrome c oxidase-assembly factor COX23, mitochondrial n=1 Tax=Cutaneotrichosporon oleaginosum TaxID=879819 RepID=A0A0J1BEF5_9TREE|nr:cytochrome c oxidase-assembly factor COX23, mitochondrial [Cutaneotrichosporon oleaginosum]KLT46494.1 cytochrome c oxidase-assembly factor COX23, mitochondrial [Cutaneotrichosporon oleaginosum]TXT15139.1 hypothetical protein COLE_01332 [Cutaneotrichosporon oleaginosum]